jgi:hypothetical protein
MPAYTLGNATSGSTLLSNAGYVRPNTKTDGSLTRSIRVSNLLYDICVAVTTEKLFSSTSLVNSALKVKILPGIPAVCIILRQVLKVRRLFMTFSWVYN